MTRLLFWLALIFLVIAAIRSKLKSASRPPQPQPGRPRAAEPPAQAEAMLCCAHCGVHYPASENVAADGRNYCSAAHAGLPAP